MKIVVEQLRETPRHIAGTVAPYPVPEGDDRVRLDAPISFAVHVREDEGRVTVYGWIHSVATAPCSRCLKDVRMHVDREIEVSYVRRPEEPVDEEAELDEGDLDTDYYSGDSIDLRAVLTEQILLDLPMKILCSDDCKGLCPQCGADLNEGGCDCEPPVDPRLSPLAGLRDRL